MLMRDFLFDLKFALKNALSSKLRLFSIIIMLVIVFSFSFLLFGVEKIVLNAQSDKSRDKYNGFDFYVTVNEYSNQRFYSIKNDIINKIEEYDKLFINVSSFLYTPLYYQGEKSGNINLYTGKTSDFNTLTNNNFSTLNSDEVIISKEFKDKYRIKDSLTLCFNGSIKTFKVKGESDCGIFNKDSIFLERSFLKDLLDFDISSYLYQDLVNISFFKVKEGVLIDDVIRQIDNGKLVIDYCVNQDLISRTSSTYISSLKVIFLFVLAIILIVLNSLFKRIFTTKVEEYLTINSIGGENKYFFKLVAYEIGFYSLIAFIIALGIYGIISLALGKIIYQNASSSFDFLAIICGFFFIFGIISLLICFNYFWFKKLSLQNKENQNEQNYFVNFITIGLLIVICQIFSYQYQGLFISILIFIFLFLGIKCLFILINKYYKGNSLFALFNLKNISKNKTYFNSIMIFASCLICIAGVCSVREFILKSAKGSSKAYYFDSFIVNIYNYDDDFKNYLSNNTEYMKEGGYYRLIKIKEYDYTIDVGFAIDSQYFDEFFSFDISKEKLANLDTEEKNIILNSSLQTMFNLKTGDQITVNLGEEEIPVTIAGFADFGISNQCILSKSVISNINTVLIKNPSDDFYSSLNDYTSKMFVLYQVDEYIDGFLKSGLEMTYFISALCIFIILLLFIVIINNSLLFYEEMKDAYAKIRILGLSKKELLALQVKENLFIFLIVGILSFLASIILIKNVSYLLIFFKSYYTMPIDILTILIGLGIGLVAYFLSQIVFIKKVCNINLIENVKTF